jgi:hypothetical protein
LEWTAPQVFENSVSFQKAVAGKGLPANSGAGFTQGLAAGKSTLF